MSKCFPMSEPQVLKHSKTVVFDETTFLENYCFLIHSILTERVAMNKLLLQINLNIYPTLLLDTLQFFVSGETSEIEVFKSWWCIDFLMLIMRVINIKYATSHN